MCASVELLNVVTFYIITATVYSQGGQPCRLSPQVANWPWKCDNLSDKRTVKFRTKFSNVLIEPILFRYLC
jgi:hypothetical protein